MTAAVWGIDTIDAGVLKVPLGAPVIWAYVTGTTIRPEIQWEPEDIARFPHSQVFRIDQGFGDQLDEARAFDADEYDLEAGGWTVDRLAGVVRLRNERQWSTRVYASVGPFDALLGKLRTAQVPMRSVFWREAHWGLTEAEARGQLGGIRYALQYASPSDGGDLVIPGTSLTLAVAGADLNVMALVNTGWQG